MNALRILNSLISLMEMPLFFSQHNVSIAHNRKNSDNFQKYIDE